MIDSDNDDLWPEGIDNSNHLGSPHCEYIGIAKAFVLLTSFILLTQNDLTVFEIKFVVVTSSRDFIHIIFSFFILTLLSA